MLILIEVYKKQYKYLKIFFSLLILSVCIFLSIFSFLSVNQKPYSLFVEFDDAYGLKQGTPVTYKGVNIGVVNRISLSINKVVVLLTIRSSKTLIPYNSIFEANQIGLFNDIIISIKPQSNVNYSSENIKVLGTDEMGSSYTLAKFLPHDSYIRGYKGISYDDLIRSTTRIAQRFDDPRFFSLFYLLLKNSLYISDEILILIYNSSIASQMIIHSVVSILS